MVHPDNTDTKTRWTFIDALQEKHPGMMVPDLPDEENAAFKEYKELLQTVHVDCDAEIVEEELGQAAEMS